MAQIKDDFKQLESFISKQDPLFHPLLIQGPDVTTDERLRHINEALDRIEQALEYPTEYDTPIYWRLPLPSIEFGNKVDIVNHTKSRVESIARKITASKGGQKLDKRIARDSDQRCPIADRLRRNAIIDSDGEIAAALARYSTSETNVIKDCRDDVSLDINNQANRSKVENRNSIVSSDSQNSQAQPDKNKWVAYGDGWMSLDHYYTITGRKAEHVAVDITSQDRNQDRTYTAVQDQTHLIDTSVICGSPVKLGGSRRHVVAHDIKPDSSITQSQRFPISYKNIVLKGLHIEAKHDDKSVNTPISISYIPKSSPKSERIQRASQSQVPSNSKESNYRGSDATILRASAVDILGEGPDQHQTVTSTLLPKTLNSKSRLIFTSIFRIFNLIRAVAVASVGINYALNALRTPAIKSLGASPVYIANLVMLCLDIIIALIKAFPKVMWIFWDVTTWDPVKVS